MNNSVRRIEKEFGKDIEKDNKVGSMIKFNCEKNNNDDGG